LRLADSHYAAFLSPSIPRSQLVSRFQLAPQYQTGEEIHRGDRVSYGGNAGVIELVVEVCSTIRSPGHVVGQFALDPRAATD